MSRTKALLKNTVILIVAKISTHVVSFFLLPIYTALLSTTEYGEIDLYTSLNMIILPFLTLQLENGLFRYFITADSEDERKQIISSGITMVGVSVLIATALYYGITAFFPVRYRYYLYFYYLALTCTAVLMQVARAEGKIKVYSVSSFIASALAVGLNALFIAGFHWKVEGILMASIIAQSVSAIYILLTTNTVQNFKFSAVRKDSCSKLLKYSTPLVFNQVSSWVINYSDRLIIIRFLGIAANGIYAVANKFSNIMNTFFGLFNVAWTESVVRCMSDEDGEEYISSLFTLIFNAYLIVVTGIMNLLPFVYDRLINISYAPAYFHVPILLGAMFFSGMAATLGSIYIACKKTKSISVTTTTAAVCNIVVHLVLLKPAGLYAASLSTLVSFALLFLYRLVFIRNIFPLKIYIGKMAVPICVTVFSAAAYVIRKPLLVLLGLIMNLLYLAYMVYAHRTSIMCLLKNEAEKSDEA